MTLVLVVLAVLAVVAAGVPVVVAASRAVSEGWMPDRRQRLLRHPRPRRPHRAPPVAGHVDLGVAVPRRRRQQPRPAPVRPPRPPGEDRRRHRPRHRGGGRQRPVHRRHRRTGGPRRWRPRRGARHDPGRGAGLDDGQRAALRPVAAPQPAVPVPVHAVRRVGHVRRRPRRAPMARRRRQPRPADPPDLRLSGADAVARRGRVGRPAPAPGSRRTSRRRALAAHQRRGRPPVLGPAGDRAAHERGQGQPVPPRRRVRRRARASASRSAAASWPRSSPCRRGGPDPPSVGPCSTRPFA